MKPTVALLVLSLLPFIGKPTTSDNSFNATALGKRVVMSLVRVEYPNYETNQTHTCTGFVVDAIRGRALTARHCVADESSEVYVDGESSYVIGLDGQFALVVAEPMVKPPLDIRKDKPDYGETVLSVGYGYGELTMFVRHVAAVVMGDVAVDGPLAPGMSGGPTVDAKGRVVFLNQASNEVIGAGCGGDEMREFLKSMR